MIGLKITRKVCMQDLTKILFQNVQNSFYKTIIRNSVMSFITKIKVQRLYSVFTFKYEELLGEYIKKKQNRFLDDCYTVLRNQIFRQCLDILIKRNENGIWIDLYHKLTDKQRCLPLHRVTQAIANKTTHFVQIEGFVLLQKIIPRSQRI